MASPSTQAASSIGLQGGSTDTRLRVYLERFIRHAWTSGVIQRAHACINTGQA